MWYASTALPLLSCSFAPNLLLDTPVLAATRHGRLAATLSTRCWAPRGYVVGLLLERRGRVARGGHEACEAPAPILGHDVRDVAPAWIGRGARDHATHLKNRDVVGRLVDEPDVEDGGVPRVVADVVVLGHEGHAPGARWSSPCRRSRARRPRPGIGWTRPVSHRGGGAAWRRRSSRRGRGGRARAAASRGRQPNSSSEKAKNYTVIYIIYGLKLLLQRKFFRSEVLQLYIAVQFLRIQH